MDETSLRHLEQRFKMRVRTGCETCRIRRVKCDETKPECTRCTKTGRKCSGYTYVTRQKGNSAFVGASYRNSSFLVIPQARHPSLSRSPSRSLSPDPLENRSFHYFRTRTLPRWTEFFESELWGRKVLQLTHVEPAIKHGILALSTMHEEFEAISPGYDTKRSSFAFLQYMQAVKHSNDLLKTRKGGKVNLEKVLIACVIFTCYENLAGNFKAANMHLHNGLRILKQHKYDLGSQMTSSEESVANILYRFDLQAMSFSENDLPYNYTLDGNPGCPKIPEAYTNNSAARNDLVGLLRGTFWASGVAFGNPSISEHPSWQHTHAQLLVSCEKWGDAFTKYQEKLLENQQSNSKIYAGDTLLRIYELLMRVIIGSGAGNRAEIAWDGSINDFKTMVDLAETLSMSQARSAPLSQRSYSPNPQPATSAAYRPIAPKQPMIGSSPSPPATFEIVFRLESAPQSPPSTHNHLVVQRAPSSFSPSFELTPILPMFLVASRCRDPLIRRRAIAMLLNFRRQEGVWDSLNAGLVAVQWLKLEERLGEFELPPDNWVPFNKNCRQCQDIPEERRITDVRIMTNIAEGTVGIAYCKSGSIEWIEEKNARESKFFIGEGSEVPIGNS